MISTSDRHCNTWLAHSSGLCLLIQCLLRQTEGVFTEPRPNELNGPNSPSSLPLQTVFSALCRALQCVRALLHDGTKASSSFLYSLWIALLSHELQLYETIWQAIKKINKYAIQESIRSISMAGFIKKKKKTSQSEPIVYRYKTDRFVISNCKKAFSAQWQEPTEVCHFKCSIFAYGQFVLDNFYWDKSHQL